MTFILSPKRLRFYRKEAKKKQHEVAQLFGVERTTYLAAIVGKDIKTILGYYLKPDLELAKQKMIEADNRASMRIAE